MRVELKLNGAASDQGFVVAGGNGVELTAAATDGAEVEVELRAAGPAASNIKIAPTALRTGQRGAVARIESSGLSTARSDHAVEAVVAGAVVGRLAFTSVHSPQIQFEGRFQCRLATDPDGFGHPWGEDSSFGMYAVRGPDPTNPIEPPLDRIIRFQEPVALRRHSLPFGVFVRRVLGRLADGSLVEFEAGDSVIGEPARLGANCIFDAADGTVAQPGWEPITNFEFEVGSRFRGATDPGLPRPSPSDPPPSNAPYADGFLRMDQMSSLKPADFGYPDATWAARSTRLVADKEAALRAEVPTNPNEAAIRDRRLQEHSRNKGGIEFSIRMLERYTGIIDKQISIDPTGSPALHALLGGTAHRWYAEFFDFDTDTHCGTVWGTLG